MTNKMLKLTPISLSIFAAFNVNAALYQIIEVTPSGISADYEITTGTAIQDSSAGSCFDSSSVGGVSCENFVLGGETRATGTIAGSPVDGVSYREEAPFAMDNSFSYVQTSSDFENYCDAQLLYSTCEPWGDVHWEQWTKELDGNNTVNSVAFLSDGSLTIDESNNSVINQVTSGGDVVGIISSLGDERASVTAESPVTFGTDEKDDSGEYFDKSRAWKTDGIYTVGSVSYDYENDYGDYYSSKAAIWKSGTDVVAIDWPSDDEDVSDKLAQGSIRDFVIVGGVIYGVGFNTWNDSYNNMNATIFTVNEADYANSDNWTSNNIDNARVRISGDYTYSNTVLNSVNDNLVAIGEAKRAGGVPADGAAPNRPFVIADVSDSDPTAIYFANKLTFSEAGGQNMAINNYNEIVGQIDTEDTRENSGKPRRKRGFIYPYDGTGTDNSRMSIFDDQGWLIDDLTNGGVYSSANNQYRILSANDINDAGAIAATAIKCVDGEYDDTTHDAMCGDGTGDETTVAVKLIPIVGATSGDIEERGYESATSSRSGGSLGVGIIGLLSLMLFGRRKGLFCKF
ncbi:DUF3466 family protein [Vibrio sp. RC27]